MRRPPASGAESRSLGGHVERSREALQPTEPSRPIRVRRSLDGPGRSGLAATECSTHSSSRRPRTALVRVPAFASAIAKAHGRNMAVEASLRESW
jgi:hypothetical protein